MRDELDDHRLSINENTDEIAASNGFLCELNKKLDRITERVDELTLLIRGQKEEKKFKLQALTGKEKGVFHLLYSMTESQPYVSYEQLAKKALLAKSVVMDHVTYMIQKGIPVVKKLQGSVVFLKLDADFRQLQAKQNIVGINSLLTCWLPR